MLWPILRASAVKWFVIFGILPFHSPLAHTSSLARREPHPYAFWTPFWFFNSIRDQELEIPLEEIVNFLKCNRKNEREFKMSKKWKNMEIIETNRSMRLVRIGREHNGRGIAFWGQNLPKKSLQCISINLAAKGPKRFNLQGVIFTIGTRILSNFLVKFLAQNQEINGERTHKYEQKQNNLNNTQTSKATSGGRSKEVRRTMFPSESTSLTMKSEYLIG